MKKFEYELTLIGDRVHFRVIRMPPELINTEDLGKFNGISICSENFVELFDDHIYLLGTESRPGADEDSRVFNTKKEAKAGYERYKTALEQFARTINSGWSVCYVSKN